MAKYIVLVDENHASLQRRMNSEARRGYKLVNCWSYQCLDEMKQVYHLAAMEYQS